MNKIVIATLMLTSMTLFAKDMSENEDFKHAYRLNKDGSSTYIGKCLLHEDYELKSFTVVGTIQKYTEDQKEIKNALNKYPKSLRAQLKDVAAIDNIEQIDDITIMQIVLKNNPNSNLIRFNIGVGGGNGMFLIFKKVKNKFQLLSYTMDGDLNFCDEEVWGN